MPEVLVYGPIESYTVAPIMQQIDANVDSNELTLRINSGGGSPEYGWGFIAKYAEFSGAKKIKVDGKAFSMGGFACLYADEVEALDVSEFMFHRAAYPSWCESNAEFFTPEIKSNLQRINKHLETAFRNRVDVEKFETLKGVKVKDLFSMDSRIDVFLSASEAKSIGIVTKINKITPEKKASIAAEMARVAASFTGIDPIVLNPVTEQNNDIKEQQIKTKKMTIEELKAQHPAVYTSILNAGIQQGVEAERDRVGAWAAFSEADPKAVQEGIASGKDLSQTAMAEFSVKLVSKARLNDLSDEGKDKNGATVTTDKPEVPEVETEKTAQEKLEAQIKAEIAKFKKS